MKTNFCDQIDNIQRLLKAYRRLRARSVDEVCFLVVEGRQGYGKTHAIHWWATRHGCPLCTFEHDVDSQTHAASSAQTLGMPTSARRCRCMHGSCGRAAGCGAGTRRAGIRGLCTHHRRGRPHSAAEGTDGDGAGAGRPDRTSDCSGGQRRLGVSARHVLGILEEDMGVGGVQAGYDYKISAIWRARSATDDLAIWLRKVSRGRICALERLLRRIENFVQDRPDGSLICLADMAGRELARDRSHRPIRVPNPQPELRVVR